MGHCIKASQQTFLKTMAIDPISASAAEIARAVNAGETSATEVIQSTLLAIRMRDPLLNCFTAITEERARKRAQAVDRAGTRNKGPLAGVPFAAKNLFDADGITRHGSAAVCRGIRARPRLRG